MRWPVVLVAVAVLALWGMLVVPASAATGSVHVVRPGETLYRIALRYGVSVDALAAANRIADPARIRAGQVLRIPPRPSSRTAGPQRAPAARPPAPGVRADAASVQVRRVTLRYTVSRGDTLYGIARRFGTTVAALRSANGLRSDLIRPGQRLVIPGARVAVRIPPPGPTFRLRVASADPPPAAASGEEGDLHPGDEIIAPRPLRVRQGPAGYFTTVAVVAAQTPLVVAGRQGDWYEVRLPDGTAGWLRKADLAPPPPAPADTAAGPEVLVREALQYLGTRYVWGGSSAEGVDCSGFVYLVFSSFAPEMVRLRSFDYFRLGVPVAQAGLQPGDLVFFTTYAPGPSHVGIYLGDRRFIHASSSARQVTISSLDDPYYAARYVGARRLAP